VYRNGRQDVPCGRFPALQTGQRPCLRPFETQESGKRPRAGKHLLVGSQKIEQVRVERRPYQFTYEDDLGAHFMHTETFEEINIDRNLINNYDLITDGQIVEVMFHTEKEAVLSAELPPIVDMEVIYTEPGIKGDTASTNSLKPATVNSATAKDGATIRVPLFINTGDKIRVDTRTREYYERIK
jgi:elongation factor P